jgi:hypothetical protein
MQPQLKSFRLANKRPLTSHLTHDLIADIRADFLELGPSLMIGCARWHSRRELRSLSHREIADFCPKLTEALREAKSLFGDLDPVIGPGRAAPSG